MWGIAQHVSRYHSSKTTCQKKHTCILGYYVNRQNELTYDFLGHTFEETFRRLNYVKSMIQLLQKSYWDRLPPELQDRIPSLATRQHVLDTNQEHGWDQLHKDLIAYHKLKHEWGLGHV